MSKLRLSQVSFDVPEGWSDLSMLSVVAPIGDGFRANIVVTAEPLGALDLAAYARRQKERLQHEVPGYRADGPKAATVGGLDGWRLEHSFKTDGEGEVTQLQFFASRGSDVITFSFTHTAPKFEALRELAERTLKSLRLTS